MKIKSFQNILNAMIPGCKILTYQVLQRNQLNENNEWVPDTPSIFVSISYVEDINNFSQLSEEISDMTGYEVNIDEGLSVKRYINKINYIDEG